MSAGKTTYSPAKLPGVLGYHTVVELTAEEREELVSGKVWRIAGSKRDDLGVLQSKYEGARDAARRFAGEGVDKQRIFAVVCVKFVAGSEVTVASIKGHAKQMLEEG